MAKKKKLATVTLKGAKYYAVNIPAGFDGNANRSKRYVRSERAAVDLFARIRGWKLNRKHKPDTIELAESDKQWIAYLHAELGADLSELPRIIRHWHTTARAITSPLTVQALCERFITYRESRPGSPRTLSDMRQRFRRFAELFGDIQAHEITPAQVRDYMDTGKHPRNDYKVLSVLFKFAKERRTIAINPLDEIKRPSADNTEPGIYAPDDLRKLLKTAAKHFPAALPFVAVSGLAGLRSSELVGMYAGEETLQWADVLWSKQLILIRPEVAKTTKRKAGDRRYVPLEPALVEWLKPHRRESGPVVPYAESSLRKLLRGTKKEPAEDDTPECFGLFRFAGVQAVDNGLRHSFASYWLARSGKEGFGALARIMGNSEAVVRRHYVEVLAPGDGDQWFAKLTGQQAVSSFGG